jgi:short-subunit dehydrogenase
VKNLQGKYVLLTGGSRGIGPFIAEALARKGAHIALAARSEEALRRTASSLRTYGVQTIICPVDLAQARQRHDLVRTVLDEFGCIDILVNNAGVEMEGSFLRLSWEAIRETMEVNLAAPMALTHLVLPHMVDRKGGYIVNIASIGAKSGTPYDAVYCGTKAGLTEWTRGLRVELTGTGVYFSTIFPGYVTETGMFARFDIMPPWIIGSCTPSQVARTVVRAIERRKQEVIVNSRPLRPAYALAELFPTMRDRLVRLLGVVNFQRRKVGE